jgi:hypothetical protein
MMPHLLLSVSAAAPREGRDTATPALIPIAFLPCISDDVALLTLRVMTTIIVKES